MPEPNDPTATTSDPVVTAPTGLEASAAPVTSPARDAVIQKYEALYGSAPVDEAVVTDPVVTETASAEPVVDPRDAALAAMAAELAAIKEAVTPKPAPAEPVVQEDWLKLLADGKKTEGEQALLKLLAPQIEQQAVQQAIARINMQSEINTYTEKVRADNADILPMEQYIANAANVRIQAAQAAGTIKTPADYVTVYKQAVAAEIENARKLVQTFRGAGKQEANVRNQVVVASPTIKPNAVNTEREAPKPGEPEVEDASSYLAKRQAQHARNSGLSTTA